MLLCSSCHEKQQRVGGKPAGKLMAGCRPADRVPPNVNGPSSRPAADRLHSPTDSNSHKTNRRPHNLLSTTTTNQSQPCTAAAPPWKADSPPSQLRCPLLLISSMPSPTHSHTPVRTISTALPTAAAAILPPRLPAPGGPALAPALAPSSRR